MKRERPPQERDRLPGWRLVTILVGGLMIMGALGVWSYFTWRARARDLRPQGFAFEQSLGPPQARQGVEEGIFSLNRPAARLAAQQRARLASFGWVDRAHGVAHIPIDDAIDAVAVDDSRAP